MKQNIYSIKDIKIGYTQIFTAPNNAFAIRMFGETVKGEGTLIHSHPEDFELYKIGEINQENGEIVADLVYLEKAQTFCDK